MPSHNQFGTAFGNMTSGQSGVLPTPSTALPSAANPNQGGSLGPQIMNDPGQGGSLGPQIMNDPGQAPPSSSSTSMPSASSSGGGYTLPSGSGGAGLVGQGGASSGGTGWFDEGGTVDDNAAPSLDDAMNVIQDTLDYGRQKSGIGGQGQQNQQDSQSGVLPTPGGFSANTELMRPSQNVEDQRPQTQVGQSDGPQPKMSASVSPSGPIPQQVQQPYPYGPRVGVARSATGAGEIVGDPDQPNPANSFAGGGDMGDPAANGMPPQPQTNQPTPQPGQTKTNASAPPSMVGYAMGSDAVSPDIVQALEAKVDPQGQMDGSTRKLLAIASAPDQQTQWGMMQHYRQKFNAYASFARAALQGSQQKPGDPVAAAKAATQAFENVPDGTQTTFQPAQGGIQVHIHHLVGGKGNKSQGFDAGGDVEDAANTEGVPSYDTSQDNSTPIPGPSEGKASPDERGLTAGKESEGASQDTTVTVSPQQLESVLSQLPYDQIMDKGINTVLQDSALPSGQGAPPQSNANLAYPSEWNVPIRAPGGGDVMGQQRWNAGGPAPVPVSHAYDALTGNEIDPKGGVQNKDWENWKKRGTTMAGRPLTYEGTDSALRPPTGNPNQYGGGAQSQTSDIEKEAQKRFPWTGQERQRNQYILAQQNQQQTAGYATGLQETKNAGELAKQQEITRMWNGQNGRNAGLQARQSAKDAAAYARTVLQVTGRQQNAELAARTKAFGDAVNADSTLMNDPDRLNQRITQMAPTLQMTPQQLAAVIRAPAEPVALQQGQQQGQQNTQLSQQDQTALTWATNNPTDPRAAKIKQRLGM